MRKDVLEVIKQYKEEIIKYYEPTGETVDWWHYLDDVSINVHDYGDTGEIHINLYDWFEDVGTVDMIDTDSFTLEEFKKL